MNRDENLLLDAINHIRAGNNQQKIKVATKRARRSDQLAKRIKANAEVADKLLALTKQLNKSPENADEVEKLVDIVQELLDNNAKLHEAVGETLLDIPD